MPARGTYRGVLEIHDARMLIAASAASQMGNWLYNAALLAYVYIATGSAAWVGAATICRLLPYALLGPSRRRDRRPLQPTDRAARRRLLRAAADVRPRRRSRDRQPDRRGDRADGAGVSGRHRRAPRHDGTASRGWSARRDWVRPMRCFTRCRTSASIIGPGDRGDPADRRPELGRLRRQRTHLRGVGAAHLATAATARDRRERRATGSARVAQLQQGLRTARLTPFVLPLFVIVAMAEFTYGAQTVQLVLYAEQSLGLGAEGYGYLLAASGLGGLLSVLINARLSTSAKVSGIVVVTGAVFCAHADRLRGGRRPRAGARGDADRRNRARGVRSRRRNDPGAQSSRQTRSDGSWGSTTRWQWRRWWPARCWRRS